MITVMGATGNTGREIVRLLAARGVPVRALGRNRERLSDLGDGVETRAGDLTDVTWLTEAFRGSDAVFTLLPTDPSAPDYAARHRLFSESIVAAIAGSGVSHVVALSSLGTEVPTGTGFVETLHDHEERLRGLTRTNVLIYRCGYYFENFAASLDATLAYGVVVEAVEPNVLVPMIATRDTAAAAAGALVARDWSGTLVRELLGPRDLTFPEAARILGEALGRPDLAYARLPDDALVAALQEAGFSADAAHRHIQLGRAISDGTVVTREGRTVANTTTTTLETYAADLVSQRAPVIA